MFKRRDIAEDINKLMLDYGAKLDNSVLLVQQQCSIQEFESYRRVIGQIMGTMLVDIMNQIYQEHPDLMPDELKPKK